MGRTILICTAILAVAVYAQWEELEQVPVGVEDGAGIVFGANRIWGIFPDRENNQTHFAAYNPATLTWELQPDPILDYLSNTALTFQSLENGVVFLIGNQPNGLPVLYSYDLARQNWTSEPIIQPSFLLGPGVSLAYVPNLSYNQQLYPVPGWLYCLPGGPDCEKQFWRYSIPSSLEPVPLDGIYPGDGALIADQTPVFVWRETPDAIEYRLVVAIDPDFSNTVIDVITTSPRYQVETRMANGDYYWKTASRSSGGSWNWGTIHRFTLQGGWIRLADIPKPIAAGAALAYEDNHSWYFVGGTHCLIALVGGGNHEFYVYARDYDLWYTASHPTGVAQNPGTALATYIYGPFNPNWRKKPKAIFGGNSEPSHYILFRGWETWAEANPLPVVPGPGASHAYSPDDYVYMVVGEDEQGIPRNSFFRVYTPDVEESELSGAQGASRGTEAGFVRLKWGKDQVTIDYYLGAITPVRISVYDALGRKKTMLFSGVQPAGTHQVIWNLLEGGVKVVSGAYFILLDTGNEQVKLKVVVH